jgi:hypothetical protein
MKYQNFICPYELALKLHELGVNSESEFYFVKEMKGGETQIDSVVQNTMRYSYRKEGDLIPAYMSHELGEILPSMINVSKSKIWDDWLQLTQYFPKAGMSEMTLKVVKANDECSGCVFENSLYNCTRSNCMEYEREDGESIKYIIVNTNEWRKYNTQDNG